MRPERLSIYLVLTFRMVLYDGIAYSSLRYIKPFIYKKNLASIYFRPSGVTNVDVLRCQ